MNVEGYEDMHTVMPAAKSGPFEVLHFTVTPKHVVAWGGSAEADWTQRFWREGKYVALTLNKEDGKHETVMTDSDFERWTNKEVLREAQGDVLIAGLGIGMLPYHLCRLDNVNSVTVLELEPDVIALVYPHIKHEKLRVICADAGQPPFRERRAIYFDYSYIDIWPEAGVDWEEIQEYIVLYAAFSLRVNAWLAEYNEIFDTQGIGSLPDEARPLSGWYLYPDDGSHSLEARLDLVFGIMKEDK